MHDCRKYGKSPFTVAVIHGGPGAAGEGADLARELSAEYGILEPLQTVPSVEGQIRELEECLTSEAALPVTLVGHSYGAMLGIIFSAQHPALVKKLVLVSSGVFDEAYAAAITQTRLDHLTTEERAEIGTLEIQLDVPGQVDRNEIFGRIGELLDKADSFDPFPSTGEKIDYRYDIFTSAWQDMEKLRRKGDLKMYAGRITCPVVAIHGDYDPHPADGVRIPLSGIVQDFRFILLSDCGHCPWRERRAHDRFYRILHRELQ